MMEMNMMIGGDEDKDDNDCLLKVHKQPSPECFQVWAADKVSREIIPQSFNLRKERVHASVNSPIENLLRSEDVI